MAVYIAVWVWCRVLLQYLDYVLPMHPVEIIPHYDSGVGQPWAPWKGALSFVIILGEAYLIDLKEVLVLNHWEPLPVDLCIGSM